MPNYDYECAKCGYTFEVFQKMTDHKLTRCPKCKGKVKRLIGAGTGIIFKGSGFYQTDYKKTSRAGGTVNDSPKPAQAKPDECPAKKEGCNGCR
ncbi:MAG TPA: zinc ribbon domain-containing protein [Candidatus Omnitrophota bacterium]|nr:zinc ribbon domain-containing protein [Candidatus Omnitrophota bacterium]HQJ15488.1 zinc ribbon domain-containing protein [Candidatus Omnitrophota bacterium]